jgi:hypothetical protein
MKPAHDVPSGAFRGFELRLDHRLESERIAHLAHLHAMLDVACGHAGLMKDALVIERLAEPTLDVLAPLDPLDALLRFFRAVRSMWRPQLCDNFMRGHHQRRVRKRTELLAGIEDRLRPEPGLERTGRHD